ncbi:uncharacterized protein LOC130798647 [Amaranthus tricolor]|uniref:uncharacterized protein LOC130798647 n=1 Tax=Amaranthus tricolor TaxID=29722 RepID=UPI00258F11CA|nr:uncharacterized protein LOC130798647 [Amaranthus tricolor]
MLGYSKFAFVAFLFLTVASAAVMDARIQEVTSGKMLQQKLGLEAEIRALASLKTMERGLASNIKKNFMGVFDEHCAPAGTPCAGIDEICCSGSCIPHPRGFRILVCA